MSTPGPCPVSTACTRHSADDRKVCVCTSYCIGRHADRPTRAATTMAIAPADRFDRDLIGSVFPVRLGCARTWVRAHGEHGELGLAPWSLAWRERRHGVRRGAHRAVVGGVGRG